MSKYYLANDITSLACLVTLQGMVRDDKGDASNDVVIRRAGRTTPNNGECDAPLSWEVRALSASFWPRS